MSWTTLTTGSWLLHTAMGGGLLLLVSCVLMRWTAQPARRQRLGEWSLAAALLLALLSLGPRWLTVTLPAEPAAAAPVAVVPDPSWPEPVAAPAVLPLAEGQAANSCDEPAGSFAPGNHRREGRVVREPVDTPHVKGSVPPAAASAVVPAPDAAPPWFAAVAARWPVWVAGAYGLLLACLTTGWLLGHFALWRLLRDAGPAPAHVERLFAAMRVGPRRPRLLVSHRFRTPASCGLFRPTVVLPAAMCRPADLPVLRWVFAHELTHLERRDAWSCLLLSLGRAVYFYLPWYWWLRRQVRLCQEYVADAAAAGPGQAVDYAQFLVQMRATPVLPACAAGVSGRTSDLFRRITMLLQPSVNVEKRCPRAWSLATVAGLACLAVVVSGFGLASAASADDDTKQDKQKQKQEKAKKDEAPPAGMPDVEQILRDVRKQLEAAGVQLDPKQMADIQAKIDAALKKTEKDLHKWTIHSPQVQQNVEELKKHDVEIQKVLDMVNKHKIEVNLDLPDLPWSEDQPRRPAQMGINVEKPSPILAEQLNLPAGRGLVIVTVQSGSVADKAGLKARDILLELNGKPVASDTHEIARIMADVKGETSFDAVVLRKGKRETVKGMTLPEPKPRTRAPRVTWNNQDFFPPGVFAGRGAGVVTMLSRTDDLFNAFFRDDGLQITIAGKIDDGKARASSIKIKDGDESFKGESADKVPAKYRDQVKKLLDMSEKGNVHVEKK